jgi:RNA polymerase sigma-70 factor (ECF subfamily)
MSIDPVDRQFSRTNGSTASEDDSRSELEDSLTLYSRGVGRPSSLSRAKERTAGRCMSSIATGAHLGDPHAIVVDLHQRYARQLQRFCVRQLGSREEAEDATQLTFINAFRSLERGASLEFESAWLFKIAENVCQNSRRSSSRRRCVETPSGLDEYQDVIGSPEHDSDDLFGLTEALQDLPELQRRAILLREWQGLSYKDIAAEFGLSQAAVETLLFRARRSLVERLTGGSKRRSALRRSDLGSIVGALKSP